MAVVVCAWVTAHVKARTFSLCMGRVEDECESRPGESRRRSRKIYERVVNFPSIQHQKQLARPPAIPWLRLGLELIISYQHVRIAIEPPQTKIQSEW